MSNIEYYDIQYAAGRTKSLHMTICFGRFDSKISDLKKTHTIEHACVCIK